MTTEVNDGGVRIVMSDAAWEEVEKHCFSRTDIEVGGFLIGSTERDTDIRYAYPALSAVGGQMNLTFTHDVWDEVLPVIERDYPGLAIVGWYHSHPGFGIFLSDYDIFIQENFFAAPGQVALVVDPLEGSYGFLDAANGKYRQLKRGKTQRPAIDSHTEVHVTPDDAASKRRRGALAVGGVLAAAVVAGLIGWFIGNLTTSSATASADRSRIAALQSEVGALESSLAALSPTATPSPTPTPSPSPSPTPTPSPSPSPSPTPSPSPSPSPSVTPGQPIQVLVVHIVRPGETLWSIAAMYLGSGAEYPVIESANPQIDPLNLTPGTPINIPLTAEFVAL